MIFKKVYVMIQTSLKTIGRFFGMDKRTGRTTLRERKPRLKKQASVNLDSAIQLFLNVKRSINLKERTLSDYEINLHYFKTWLENKDQGLCIQDVDIEMLRQYIVWCAYEKDFYKGHPFKEKPNRGKKGMSPSSVNVRIRVLRAFFTTLYDEGVLSFNPAQNLSLMKAEQDTVQPLSEGELKKLLKAPDQRYFAQFRDYVIMMLMIDTGMRINEVCSLELKNTNPLARQIILPAINNKNRKGRVIPLCKKTAHLLEKLIKETTDNFDTQFVFVTYYGEPLNSKTIQKSLKKYADKAGIQKRVTPHVLRHCFAKFAALNGMDVFTLQKILGHADITTTRKYVQINDSDIMSQHERYSPVMQF
jgi:integrase/recombinase XerD